MSNLELNKRNTPSKRFLDTLEEKTGINKEWLLTGEGDMLKESASPGSPQLKTEETPPGKPDLYHIVEPLTGEFTIVTKEEMLLIHDLLTITKSEDPGLIEVIKNNLREFKRLCKYVNRNFANIILLERRIGVRAYDEEDRREKKASGQ